MSEDNIVAGVTQPLGASVERSATGGLATGGEVTRRYRLGRPLATGGTSSVFEATQIDLIRRVAIKILAPAHAAQPARVREFEREARLAARLQHPHIVAVHDSGRLDDGTPFMAMELVAGPTLREYLTLEIALPWDEVLRFGKQLASALACAHTSHVVHGDLSTSNVLLQETGDAYSCKLIDFGVAVEEGERGRTRPCFATPAYAAPERFAGGPPDVASDIFALGAMLTQMLGVPAPARTPVALRELLAAMLEPSPARRPKSAQEVLQRMHAIPAAAESRFPPLHVAAAASLASVAMMFVVVAAFGDRHAEATAGAELTRTSPDSPDRSPAGVALAGAPLDAVRAQASAAPVVLTAFADQSVERAELIAAVDRALSRRNERAARDPYPMMARRDGAARIAFDPSGTSASVSYRKHVAWALPGATRVSAVSQREFWSKVNGRWQLVRR